MTTTNPKIVMVFGTFDYLHAGHEDYIKQAREHGDIVIAIVGRDSTVAKVKSRKPDHDERERLNTLKESGLADKVFLGNLKDKHKIILKYKPDVICLGYDQYAFTYTLQKNIIDNKLNTEIVRLKPYRPEVYKSSIIKEKVMAKGSKKHSAQQSISFN